MYLLAPFGDQNLAKAIIKSLKGTWTNVFYILGYGPALIGYSGIVNLSSAFIKKKNISLYLSLLFLQWFSRKLIKKKSLHLITMIYNTRDFTVPRLGRKFVWILYYFSQFIGDKRYLFLFLNKFKMPTLQAANCKFPAFKCISNNKLICTYIYFKIHYETKRIITIFLVAKLTMFLVTMS